MLMYLASGVEMYRYAPQMMHHASGVDKETYLKRVQELTGKEATFYEVDIRDKSAMAHPNPSPSPSPSRNLSPKIQS